MREKRKRNAASSSKGLSVGERLNRTRLLAESDLRWNWIGTDVKAVSEITEEHRLRASGLALLNSRRACTNKYLQKSGEQQRAPQRLTFESEDPDDVIVISDSEDEPLCDKKRCRDNPYCLNYLGQEKWEDEEGAEEAYLKVHLKEEDPENNSRKRTLPVGLKNLGATCYANAFLQVWFQDLAFRSGVYRCQPVNNQQHFKDSPIFQLQVTFAALQEGNQAVFNPVKLVESLRLKTSEQQDAQEFSKLFMSHLDDEFKKQSNPELRSLLPDQFEGKMVNATVCDNCKTRSERETTFLELEVNLEKNGSLEDRIAALLAPERLSGENKYLCSVCESLEDATRYTEIRNLPPVLHISLLRFVYDLTTYERKKSKLPLKFPPYLNMSPFLQSADPHQIIVKDKNEGNIYELRGVLLHKGQSAYHGHYEAQVYNQTAKKWYQFNDEIVTSLASFHDPKADKKSIVVDNDEDGRPTKRQKRAAKSRRIDDSDDEHAVQATPASITSGNRCLTSRDAYMLIYARREDLSHANTRPLLPPEAALEIVRSSNDAHEQDCKKHKRKQDSKEEEFAKVRKMVMDIYQSWSVSSSSDPSVVVSKSAIEKWLSHWLTPTEDKKGKQKGNAETSADAQTQEDNGAISDFIEGLPAMLSGSYKPDTLYTGACTLSPRSSETISNSALLCRHDRLNPLLDKEMKLISEAAHDKMVENGFTLRPKFTVDDVCGQCIEDEFMEKLYHIEHPQFVSEFNQICNTESEIEGYWISKAWLKDWQLNKPKMHVTFRGDPSPDGPDFYSHVRCEHGNLTLNVTARRRISFEAVELLKRLFPAWDPPDWDAEVCAACDVVVHQSKESKLEQRRKAENEKALLHRLHNDKVFGRQSIMDNIPCAIVPSAFIHEWTSWLVKPGEARRPVAIDNSYMLCDHGLLNVDLSDEFDFDDTLAVVTRAEWDLLQNLYIAEPLIAVSYMTEPTTDGNKEKKVVSDVLCCSECRTKNKLNFVSTSLAIILLKSSEPVPRPLSVSPSQSAKTIPTSLINGNCKLASGRASSPSHGKANGTRQSRRLKEGKNSCRQTVQIYKKWTVKDVKIAIYKVFKIPTISQRLYYRGKELEENSETVADLEILDRDTLYLKEVEDTIVLDSDIEEDSKNTKKRDEGGAFKGTLLSGGTSSSLPSESDQRPDSSRSSSPVQKACLQCTLYNPTFATECEACQAPL
ncbi:cysteine proteinase [Phellopilus nigrolimitatus]|nr:cysteine proteinase [Phellopilus nigrolimitatus]